MHPAVVFSRTCQCYALHEHEAQKAAASGEHLTIRFYAKVHLCTQLLVNVSFTEE